MGVTSSYYFDVLQKPDEIFPTAFKARVGGDLDLKVYLPLEKASLSCLLGCAPLLFEFVCAICGQLHAWF